MEESGVYLNQFVSYLKQTYQFDELTESDLNHVLQMKIQTELSDTVNKSVLTHQHIECLEQMAQAHKQVDWAECLKSGTDLFKALVLSMAIQYERLDVIKTCWDCSSRLARVLEISFCYGGTTTFYEKVVREFNQWSIQRKKSDPSKWTPGDFIRHSSMYKKLVTVCKKYEEGIDIFWPGVRRVPNYALGQYLGHTYPRMTQFNDSNFT